MVLRTRVSRHRRGSRSWHAVGHLLPPFPLFRDGWGVCKNCAGNPAVRPGTGLLPRSEGEAGSYEAPARPRFQPVFQGISEVLAEALWTGRRPRNQRPDRKPRQAEGREGGPEGGMVSRKRTPDAGTVPTGPWLRLPAVALLLLPKPDGPLPPFRRGCSVTCSLVFNAPARPPSCPQRLRMLGSRRTRWPGPVATDAARWASESLLKRSGPPGDAEGRSRLPRQHPGQLLHLVGPDPVNDLLDGPDILQRDPARGR